MNSKIVNLPDNFIGKEDEARLESFGAFLIKHGAASRWVWQQSSGIDVEFELFRHASSDEELLARIRRDGHDNLFYADDANGRRLAEGTLAAVMAAVDALARSSLPDP